MSIISKPHPSESRTWRGWAGRIVLMPVVAVAVVVTAIGFTNPEVLSTDYAPNGTETVDVRWLHEGDSR